MDENVLDGAIAIGAEPLGAATRRVEPIRAVDAAQAHEPETGAIALLGMRAPLEEARDESPGRGAALLGPRDQARRRPFRVRAMRARHVRRPAWQSGRGR